MNKADTLIFIFGLLLIGLTINLKNCYVDHWNNTHECIKWENKETQEYYLDSNYILWPVYNTEKVCVEFKLKRRK